MAARSPSRAWGQTRNDWKPELLYGAVGGLLSIGALTAAGWPESRLLGYGIPIASVLCAALLVPIVHFLWRLAWQPWDALKADVVAIRTTVESAPPPEPKAPPKAPIDKRLTALNYVRTYDDMEGTTGFAFRRSESIKSWTDEVVHFLAEHVSGDAAERILTAKPDDRRDLMAEIAKEL